MFGALVLQLLLALEQYCSAWYLQIALSLISNHKLSKIVGWLGDHESFFKAISFVSSGTKETLSSL